MYGCSASFDRIALRQDEQAKEKVLSLISKANESYIIHESEVQSLTNELNAYKAYESGGSKNDETIKMWGKMISPTNNLYEGFIKRWKERDSLNVTFIAEFKPIISDAFDNIIALENARR